MKEEEFPKWLKYYVKSASSLGEPVPTWLRELVGGPLSETISSPIYCTRGYVFKRRTASKNRQTVNHGVVVRTMDEEYYGVIEDILEVEYPGLIKCVLFKCQWYDPTRERGVRLTKFGVTEINSSKKLNKYDPFVLASQVDQVCYIPYPRVKRIHDPWITATQINPRGRVDGVKDHDPMQQNSVDSISVVEHSLENTILVDVENLHLDDVSVGGDDNADEFDDSDNSSRSSDSSDSDDHE
ncbi:uncharacterized protein LOC110225294 [Arabidopsis lyrata subsp. lyrata]|nr:uncharacterized protein LOC110225294 [Arabidopsis lyrata subsp. lyrata]|eukprot:XP_020870326.1 uncharacterized protein LOC110225294 [Arabidopsis lyrata subsp. lyrata]